MVSRSIRARDLLTSRLLTLCSQKGNSEKEGGLFSYRPFQEVDMDPVAEMDLPELEHLELRAQNEHGFGAHQLQPLATAKLPKLR